MCIRGCLKTGFGTTLACLKDSSRKIIFCISRIDAPSSTHSLNMHVIRQDKRLIAFDQF